MLLGTFLNLPCIIIHCHFEILWPITGHTHSKLERERETNFILSLLECSNNIIQCKQGNDSHSLLHSRIVSHKTFPLYS